MIKIEKGIQNFEIVNLISQKTKNYKNADEIYKVSFDKTKDEFKNSTITNLKYEKRKVGLETEITNNSYNELKGLFVKILLVIISVYATLLTGSFFTETNIVKITIFCVGAIILLVGLFSFLTCILNYSDSLKKNIIIHHAIINALEELLEEKQKLQKATSAKTVKPKKKIK